ncbi:MAG TPA: hypothetical protein VGK90_09255 [Rhizomicrobium sp.]|jgi:hypothetical protein
MKALLAAMAMLALAGCAAPEYGMQDLATASAARTGAREAARQQYSPNCPGKSHQDSNRLAEFRDGDVHMVSGGRYAQLDDPTRDWTREQAPASPFQCPPTGKKHRYFA